MPLPNCDNCGQNQPFTGIHYYKGKGVCMPLENKDNKEVVNVAVPRISSEQNSYNFKLREPGELAELHKPCDECKTNDNKNIEMKLHRNGKVCMMSNKDNGIEKNLCKHTRGIFKDECVICTPLLTPTPDQIFTEEDFIKAEDFPTPEQSEDKLFAIGHKLAGSKLAHASQPNSEERYIKQPFQIANCDVYVDKEFNTIGNWENSFEEEFPYLNTKHYIANGERQRFISFIKDTVIPSVIKEERENCYQDLLEYIAGQKKEPLSSKKESEKAWLTENIYFDGYNQALSLVEQHIKSKQ